MEENTNKNKQSTGKASGVMSVAQTENVATGKHLNREEKLLYGCSDQYGI